MNSDPLKFFGGERKFVPTFEAGVLASSVSGRTREFGIRLAVGPARRNLLLRVIGEGVALALGGLALASSEALLAELAGSLPRNLKMPGALPIAGSALVLLIAAVTRGCHPSRPSRSASTSSERSAASKVGRDGGLSQPRDGFQSWTGRSQTAPRDGIPPAFGHALVLQLLNPAWLASIFTIAGFSAGTLAVRLTGPAACAARTTTSASRWNGFH